MVAAANQATAEKKPLSPEEEATHNELRALRDDLVDAVIKGDIDRQLKYADDDIVTTWQNGKVARGREGLLKFLKELQGSNGKVFQGYKQPPEPAELSILHGGDTAISYGTSVATFQVAGQTFDLTNHWTATLVKENGKWLMASYHVSGDLLDNPVLNAAKNCLYLAGGVGAVAGLVLGLILAKLFRRKRAAV
jgi:ketosteroid isomerase-like protein